MANALYPSKRRKATLKEKPLQHLETILGKAVKEVFSELTEKKAPKNVKKQANKIVKDYAETYRPKADEVDWDALSQDLEVAQRLFNLYQREIADKRLFELIEQDNVEFLLMH